MSDTQNTTCRHCGLTIRTTDGKYWIDDDNSGTADCPKVEAPCDECDGVGADGCSTCGGSAVMDGVHVPADTPISADRAREVADRVQREILDLVADGFIPAEVRTFGVLHDYIDANTLGGLCDEDDPNSDISGEDWARIQDLVEPWLAAGNTEQRPEDHYRVIVEGELTVGSWVAGLSIGPGYRTEWYATYDGQRPSEWDGEPYHYFREGVLGGRDQSLFGFPVASVRAEE